MGVTTATRRRAAGGLAALLMVAGGVMAGCGSGDDAGAVARAADAPALGAEGASSTATTTAVDPEEAQLAFAKCMRENGVDMPDPEAGGGGFRPAEGANVDREAMRTAMEACREHLDGVRPELSEEQRQEMEDRRLALARCMRENGVDMPDPSAEGGPERGRRLDMDDAATRAAMEACRGETGDGGGPGMGGAGGPGGPPPSSSGGEG